MQDSSNNSLYWLIEIIGFCTIFKSEKKTGTITCALRIFLNYMYGDNVNVNKEANLRNYAVMTRLGALHREMF